MKSWESKNIFLKILNLSWYNITDVLGYYKDQVSLGSPLLTILPVILGFSQLEAYNMAEANIDIWDVFNTWKAPLSSYNSTTEDVGASTKKDEDVSEAGDRSRDNEQVVNIVNKMIQVFCEEDANKLIASDYKLIKTQLVGNITSYIFALSNKSSFNLNNLKQYRYTNKLYFQKGGEKRDE